MWLNRSAMTSRPSVVALRACRAVIAEDFWRNRESARRGDRGTVVRNTAKLPRGQLSPIFCADEPTVDARGAAPMHRTVCAAYFAAHGSVHRFS
jgi:hypothetical protein